MVFGWFRTRAAPPSRLAGLLRDYPPAIPPHVGETGAPLRGEGPALTLEQALENLAWHEAVRPHRLEALRGLLAQLGFDMEYAFDLARRTAMMQARDKLLLEEFEAIGTPQTRNRFAWDVEPPAGDFIIYTLLRDLAMLDEAVMLRCVPGARMAINNDDDDIEMSFYRRPCIAGLVDRLFPDLPFSHDFAGGWFGFFYSAVPGRYRSPNPREFPGGYLAEVMDRYIAPGAALTS